MRRRKTQPLVTGTNYKAPLRDPVKSDVAVEPNKAVSEIRKRNTI
jgi:hypothetical protein